MSSALRPRLLFIDAYDSFSNNIISLLTSQLSADVTTVRIDDSCLLNDAHDSTFHAFLSSFDAVVVGPGPGDPRDPKDVGIITKLWQLPEDLQLPVLGICLGFQSLVLAFGGHVEKLTQPRHGLIKTVSHKGISIFSGVGDVKATQYHSWHARLGHSGDEQELWSASAIAPRLLPLAWDLSDADNGPILMGVRHAKRPLWGVQYHPESICTNGAGAQIIGNWWAEASAWNAARSGLSAGRTAKGNRRQRDALDSGYATGDDSRSPSPHMRPAAGRLRARREVGAPGNQPVPGLNVEWRAQNICGDLDLLPSLVDLMTRQTGQPPISLESGTKAGKPVRSETGRYSILGLSGGATFEYWTDRKMLAEQAVNGTRTDHRCDAHGAFSYLQSWTDSHSAAGGPADVPFWGGLIGFISYEAGLETIDVKPIEAPVTGPDMSFVAVERSVVVDHVGHKIYIQTIRPDDSDWLQSMDQSIQQLVQGKLLTPSDHKSWDSTISLPDKKAYCRKVEQCQDYIRAGDSYELCLTDRIPVTFHDREPSPLQLYHRLRKTNPAPFSAFLNLPSTTIISSSPERFLSWTRDGLCEFRPIKGTVQKTPGVTRADAEAILKSDKEQAENLMIVDLIRHDLNGVVVRAGGCATVPKLMQIEEYETVYQLVSVIQGQLNAASPANQHGVDVLAASLPPGSMTGAPKKRSCELLGHLEGRRRGAYSGVLGYLDVGGGGDFSVIIRSLVRDSRGWGISAGGAVTVLSDPVGEYEEMLAKSAAVKI